MSVLGEISLRIISNHKTFDKLKTCIVIYIFSSLTKKFTARNKLYRLKLRILKAILLEMG